MLKNPKNITGDETLSLIIGTIIAVAIILVGWHIFFPSGKGAPTVTTSTQTPDQTTDQHNTATDTQTAPLDSADYKDATYSIDGQLVTLTNGISVVPAAPGSESKITTQYFGDEAYADFNGDGTRDVAFILTQNNGGSGTFYYLVVGLRNVASTTYTGTNGVFLGDRIAPQSTAIVNGKILVNYAEREPTDPFTVIPSIAVSKYFQVTNGALEEVK